MTVSELISELQKLDQDSLVVTERQCKVDDIRSVTQCMIKDGSKWDYDWDDRDCLDPDDTETDPTPFTIKAVVLFNS